MSRLREVQVTARTEQPAAPGFRSAVRRDLREMERRLTRLKRHYPALGEQVELSHDLVVFSEGLTFGESDAPGVSGDTSAPGGRSN